MVGMICDESCCFDEDGKLSSKLVNADEVLVVDSNIGDSMVGSMGVARNSSVVEVVLLSVDIEGDSSGRKAAAGTNFSFSS